MPDKWYEFNLASPEVATVRIYDEIGGFGVSASEFISELDSVEAPLIRVHINFPGGSVDAGIAIMNALVAHPSNVETHVDAAAYSIASVIAQGGNRRVMAPHSRMMVHEAMALGMGYASDFDNIAKHLRETTENIASIYAEKSGKTEAYWRQKMADETRFTDKQAVSEGLADEVGRVTNLADFKIAANFEWSKYTKNHVAIVAELMEAAKAPAVSISAATIFADAITSDAQWCGTVSNGTNSSSDYIENAVAEGIRKGVVEVVAAVERLIEGKRIDPSDAARRDLEEALARVQL